MLAPAALVFQLLCTSVSAAPTHAVLVRNPAGGPTLRVTAAVGSSSSFRLSVEFIDPISSTAPSAALDSPSLDANRTMSAYTPVTTPDGSGIKTSFGELLIHADGTFTMKDNAGKTIVASTSPPTLTVDDSSPSNGRHSGITMPVTGSKTGPGATGRRPCLSNGEWGPPFTYDPVHHFFAFAVSPWGYDPDFIHCYPVSFDGLAPLTAPHTPEDSCTTITHVVPFSANGTKELAFIHTGGALGDGTDTCCNACNSHLRCTAWVFGTPPGSKGTNPPNCRLFSCVDQWVPPDVNGADDNVYLSGGLESQCGAAPVSSGGGYIHQNGWFGLGKRMDWYLAPTPNGGFDFTKALFDLTGAPAVPPLFGMGFMATYWGYSSMREVESYMYEFRTRKLPIDSFIMDYDWFGPDPCGAAINSSTPLLPDGKQGGYNCGDSGYRDGWWNNQTFPQRAVHDVGSMKDMVIAATKTTKKTCTFVPNTDYYTQGQGPSGFASDATDCCTRVCAGQTPYFVYATTSQQCYCKSSNADARKSPGNTAGTCGDPPPPVKNVTCVTAKDVFDHFHAPPLSMHFGGIRKPRTYSNLNTSGTNGWLLPLASDVGEGGGINFNFSVPECREWYAETHAHFIKDGMDFWWNDEGETSWFTYLLWNQAQADMFARNKPNVRHFTINRAYQPGMQRFPAISWTGDGQSCTHEELLRGMMNGSPLTSCDLTSPDATTLVRQYQSAVFTPIMRCHMMKGTPRFPWFWGGDAHQIAFQKALEMRYRFLPFLYSLAHAAYRTGKPISHPATFAYPGECAVPTSLRCVEATKTYMVGGVLVPSDLLGLAHTSIRPPPLENVSRAVLPESSVGWYRWNTSATVKGGQTVKETLKLSEMAVFVAAGAILPLQANASHVQRTALLGGLLEVQIYGGADGQFVMVEDDGISYDYQHKGARAAAAVRTTTWAWSAARNTLTWSVSGGEKLTSPNEYTHVAPVLFSGGRVQRAATQVLGPRGGEVVFAQQ